MTDAKGATRCFTVFNIFMDDKTIKGSLLAALYVNFEADKKHLPEEEKAVIRSKLQKAFRRSHPEYKEPIPNLICIPTKISNYFISTSFAAPAEPPPVSRMRSSTARRLPR